MFSAVARFSARACVTRSGERAEPWRGPGASVRDESGIGLRRGLDRARKARSPEMAAKYDDGAEHGGMDRGIDRRRVLGAAAAVAGAVGVGAAVGGCSDDSSGTGAAAGASGAATGSAGPTSSPSASASVAEEDLPGDDDWRIITA